MILGQGEGRQKLVALGAGKQVVIPDDAERPFASLDADLVTEPPAGSPSTNPAPRKCPNRSFKARRMSSRNWLWSWCRPCPRGDRPRGYTER